MPASPIWGTAKLGSRALRVPRSNAAPPSRPLLHPPASLQLSEASPWETVEVGAREPGARLGPEKQEGAGSDVAPPLVQGREVS